MSTPAPRWAGWIAALFGLQHAIGKVVMAVRGELGVPGHPAPPEAYEGFTGDVVLAQLGNAALAAGSVLVALALVQPWGRRVPRPVLALGAAGALGGGLAGFGVVAASLAGLREDHGQWGLDSLLLGAAALPAWAVLTVSAVRATGLRLPSRGRRAALLAGLGCVAYGAMKLSWALGGELLMRESPVGAEALRDMLAREPAMVAGHWASVALAVVGVGVAAATLREGLPRALTTWLPVAIGGLMVLRAGWAPRTTSPCSPAGSTDRSPRRAGTWRCGRRSSARGARPGCARA
jgi:hypothetical protein